MNTPETPTYMPRQGTEELIRVSAPASKKLQSLIEQDPKKPYLRVAIVGGGCNGLSYKFFFTDSFKRADILVNSLGIQLLVDPKSALYLMGTYLDYSYDMVGGGFKFYNPNAKASCSCGESFNL